MFFIFSCKELVADLKVKFTRTYFRSELLEDCGQLVSHGKDMLRELKDQVLQQIK